MGGVKKGQEFKSNLSYRETLRPAWATQKVGSNKTSKSPQKSTIKQKATEQKALHTVANVSVYVFLPNEMLYSLNIVLYRLKLEIS